MFVSEQDIAVAFVLAPVLAICAVVTFALLLIHLENMQAEREAEEARAAREAELAGLKASHTDPRREIVV